MKNFETLNSAINECKEYLTRNIRSLFIFRGIDRIRSEINRNSKTRREHFNDMIFFNQ